MFGKYSRVKFGNKNKYPPWLIEGPFSELAFTSAFAGAASGAQTVTQNFENSLKP
jgi:hypothetical protein